MLRSTARRTTLLFPLLGLLLLAGPRPARAMDRDWRRLQMLKLQQAEQLSAKEQWAELVGKEKLVELRQLAKENPLAALQRLIHELRAKVQFKYQGGMNSPFTSESLGFACSGKEFTGDCSTAAHMLASAAHALLGIQLQIDHRNAADHQVVVIDFKAPIWGDDSGSRGNLNAQAWVFASHYWCVVTSKDKTYAIDPLLGIIDSKAHYDQSVHLIDLEAKGEQSGTFTFDKVRYHYQHEKRSWDPEK
jgi:hypothetical protein